MNKPNRLAQESSPYLLQHAHNPVDWYPWGDEAIERARAENRPIFLSIGYATCHWCHVMERESFEDAEVAAYMNEHFVNVKVDREEHPDVDQIYMAAVQRMTGQGGWPMSVFLSPELEPFYAGTYFPPRSRWGRPGFHELLQAIDQSWTKDPAKLRAQGRQVREVIATRAEGERPEGLPARTAIRAAIQAMRQSFDREWGGFGSAPKFPRSMTLMLLMREATRRGDEDGSLMAMVDLTLEKMWRGGMYDHVGGGFARYSTDDKWLVPHFEKMLYDNALLVRTYVEAWQINPRDDWKRVVHETLDWVLQEMRHPEGGFFSAQDADSEGEEGLYYVWTGEQLVDLLGAEDAAFAARVFAVDEGANFEGKSVLWLKEHPRDLAAALGLEVEAFEARLAAIRTRLYEHRDLRIHPLLDDKILTSWNGLMIGAFALAGAVFDEPRYLAAAREAAAFVERALMPDGGLLRRWRNGSAALEGSLEDHAFLAQGLLELFFASGDPHHLELARDLTEHAVELFEDSDEGGFFFTEEGRAHLILRMKEPYDGATPSGNSVMILNLQTLADLFDRPDWRERGERALQASATEINRNPMAYPLLLCALDDAHQGPEEAVIAVLGEQEGALARAWRQSHRPGAITLPVHSKYRTELTALLPLLAGKEATGEVETLWHCRAGVCERPISDPAEL